MKEGDLKRLRSVWFPLYDILERTNYGDSMKISGRQGLGKDEQVEHKDLGQRNYSAWHYSEGFASLHIRQIPENALHRVNPDTDYCGWEHRVNADSSAETNVSLWWGKLMAGQLAGV